MTLEKIFEPLARELRAVRRNLDAHARAMLAPYQAHSSQARWLEQVLTHVLQTSGKGLRPALTMLAANLIRPVAPDDAAYQPLIQLATAVELIHIASLVHDDVLDDAEFRRGQPALNAKAGNKIAVLVGDMLFLRAFALLTELDLPDWQVKQDIFQILCRAAQAMCAGEIVQQQARLALQPPDFDEYVNIITQKTALFMSACCRCGALLRQPDRALASALTDFGLNFGLAFQLADDLADQDALITPSMDVRLLTHTYLERAKARLHPLSRNLYANCLMTLCDRLVLR